MQLGPYQLGYNDTPECGIYTGDARELSQAISDESVDLIVTDPPYGIGYASYRKTRMNGQPRINAPDFGEDIYDSLWLIEAFRVLKYGGALYMFTRWDILPRWQSDIQKVGLKVVQRLIWDKTHWGMGDLRYYGSQTEDILFAVKGKHVMRWEKRQGNMLVGNKYCPREGQYDHPTQKPESVIERLVLNSASRGDVVLDPFVGSGTLPVVCKRNDILYLAFDISPEYVKMARQRVRDTQPPLFVPENVQLRLID